MRQPIYLCELLKEYKKFNKKYYGKGDGPKGDILIVDFFQMAHSLIGNQWDHHLSDAHCSFALDMGFPVGKPVKIHGYS